MYRHHKFGPSYKYIILAVYILIFNANGAIFKTKSEEKPCFSQPIPQSYTVEEFYKVEHLFEHDTTVRWIRVERRLTRPDRKNMSAGVERYFTHQSKPESTTAQIPTSSANLSSLNTGFTFFCFLYVMHCFVFE